MIRRREKNDELAPRDYWGPAWVSPVAMMRDMDKLFDDFKSEWASAFMVPRAWSTDLTRAPLVDLADKGKEYVVRAEIPGIKKEDLNIELTENSIEISGEMSTDEKEESKDFLRRERRYARFYISIPLPENILTDKADAVLKDGVLTVSLPKAAPPEKKSKKVHVK
jgi:HSP20 family protein